MSINRPYRLAFLSATGAFCACCWLLAAVSLLAVCDPIWELLGTFQARLYDIGLAGHGHSHLKGMSRAFRCLWQGHLDQALAFNRGSLILFWLMIFGCVIPIIILLKRKKS